MEKLSGINHPYTGSKMTLKEDDVGLAPVMCEDTGANKCEFFSMENMWLIVFSSWY